MEGQRNEKLSRRSIDLESGSSGSQEDVSPRTSESADINSSASEDSPTGTPPSVEPRPTTSEEADGEEEEVESLASSEPSSSSTTDEDLASETTSDEDLASETTSVPSMSQSSESIESSSSASISRPFPGNGSDDEGPGAGSTSSSRSSSTEPTQTPPPESESTSSRESSSSRTITTRGASKSDDDSPSTTTISTTTQPGTTSLTTSTTTSTLSPDSTFSDPVETTSTDPENGKAMTLTPGFITEIFTSTESDGSSTVVTRVIANPTEAFHDAGEKPSGLLQNQGATAGVFTAVGFVVAGILFAIFWFCRRKRRHAQQRRWMHTLSVNMDEDRRNRQNDPFTDPPYMVYADSATPAAQGNVHDYQRPSGLASGLPMAQRRGSVGPFEDYPISGPSVTRGVAVTRDDNPFETASKAETSPSLYPASLPGEADSFYEVEMSSTSNHERSPISPTNIQPPPPAAEVVRRKVPPVYMPTPPGSAAGSQDSPRQSPEAAQKGLESPIMFTMRSLNANRNSA